MSAQLDVVFIQRARQDEGVQHEIQAFTADNALDALVALGKAKGFHFTTAEHRTAYRHDWARQAFRPPRML